MRAILATGVVATTLAAATPIAGANGIGETLQFSGSWTKYVVSGYGAVRGVPATVTPAHPATLVWRHEVAGNLELTFGTVTPGTLVRVAFSETAEYLGVDRTSDWSRDYPTDDHLPASGETWVDVPGCRPPGVCADGYRAFRFARVYVEGGSARIEKASVRPVAAMSRPLEGWFLSSDHLLNRIWYASAYTAQLMVLPNDPAVLATGCVIPGGPIEVIVDGAKRDRCPWLADQTVAEPALFLAAGGGATAPAENTLSMFANAQLPNGYIPASPIATSVLFDYPAHWVLAVDNLLLFRGELAQIGLYWPIVVKVLDDWYPAFADADGLVHDPYPPGDYAYIERGAPLVAYYNAVYARALAAGSEIARALGHTADAERWRARASSLSAPFTLAFWDAAVAAFVDSPAGRSVHPQDGNAFAILAGLASREQTTASIAYLDRETRAAWGNGSSDASRVVYPFISYFDVEARFAAGADLSALEELRRTWGWMLSAAHGTTSTTWEAIGNDGSIDGYEAATSSLASGWSTGALPALTNDVLGIRPTGPGFSTFDAIPHPGDVAWAQGRVPAPAGAITFGFRRIAKGFVMRLQAPRSLLARVGAPVASPRVLVDGRPVTPAADGTVNLRGSHVIEVLGRTHTTR